MDVNTNHNIEGTGLELDISKRLVELLGGKIPVKSEYDFGSTFYFEITLDVKDKTPIKDLSHQWQVFDLEKISVQCTKLY